ncbi:hypothetical protein INT47_007529 [Mucor saturninus]|uniref:Uncharacterized protein n=1 Tax=Mucor saturninus TaxID=64648 RepID=A0A8H7UZ08_9FUNG|nr:hypothetical protein INT47_007529 [Mucor saturninus]
MQNRAELYNPFIPNKHREGTNNKTDQVQKQVDEVVGIMRKDREPRRQIPEHA